MLAYISGPMTGIDEWNYPAFHQAAADLRRRGHEVISPAEQDAVSGLDPETSGWSDFIRWDIGVLVKCDTIVLLHGWHRSKGARLEHHIALELGMRVLTLAEALEEDVVAA